MKVLGTSLCILAIALLAGSAAAQSTKPAAHAHSGGSSGSTTGHAPTASSAARPDVEGGHNGHPCTPQPINPDQSVWDAIMISAMTAYVPHPINPAEVLKTVLPLPYTDSWDSGYDHTDVTEADGPDSNKHAESGSSPSTSPSSSSSTPPSNGGHTCVNSL